MGGWEREGWREHIGVWVDGKMVGRCVVWTFTSGGGPVTLVTKLRDASMHQPEFNI